MTDIGVNMLTMHCSYARWVCGYGLALTSKPTPASQARRAGD